MSRKPSPETQLKNSQRELRATQADLASTRQDMLMYKARATQFAQDVVDWKARFDALLKVVPSQQPNGDKQP